MPIKKKKISELTLSDNLKGLYTIGVKLIDGVQTSVKIGLEHIQVAYDDIVKVINDAIAAIKDVRQLEATVEENEENREVAESQRNASEQGRQTVESERATKENERIITENARKLAETDRSTSELARREAEEGRVSAESTREESEDSREATEATRTNAETTRETSEQGRKDAESLRVIAEDDRVQEFATLKEESETATENAINVANHPTYIGADNYVYQWDFTTSSYNKTDIFVKGDAFNVTRTYLSIEAMNADLDNTDIIEGSFVLINTDDVENPDNGRLYIKVRNEDATYSYSFLVDMSGAIGFTGKTPQFVRGAITTGVAGSDVQLSLSESGVDGDGNPVYALNVTIPRGNPGASFKVLGHFGTVEALKVAVPDGSVMDGFYSVGSLPYIYYAWYDGDWQSQGRLQGIDGKSAYQVAVDNGFVGTEAEWLASLVGGKGKPGIPGDNGTSCTHTWDGTVLTVTSASGTSSSDLKGKDGNPLDIVDNLTTDDRTKALSANMGKKLDEEKAGKDEVIIKNELIPAPVADIRFVILLWECGDNSGDLLTLVGDITSQMDNYNGVAFSININCNNKWGYIQASGLILDSSYTSTNLVKCIYEGKQYIALDCPDGGSSYDKVMFIGYYNVKPLFTSVSYFDGPSGCVLNQEINDSISVLCNGTLVLKSINNLTTNSTINPLSAAMGKKLNDEKANKKKILGERYDWYDDENQISYDGFKFKAGAAPYIVEFNFYGYPSYTCIIEIDKVGKMNKQFVTGCGVSFDIIINIEYKSDGYIYVYCPDLGSFEKAIIYQLG